MVRYRRNFIAGGTYFFTVTLADRRSAALTGNIDALRSAFRETRRSQPFDIDAIVVLPDHLHAVMTLPPGDADFSNRWRIVKRRFTDATAASRVGGRTAWQSRFWEHTIRDDRDFAAHVDYVHFNPVKHGVARRARDWPYSSFHRYVRQGLLPEDWAGDPGEVQGGFGERQG